MGENYYQKEPVMKRAFMFLEDGDFQRAYQYFERVLDMDPECAQAYLGSLMAELKARKPEDLKNCVQPFDNLNNYQKILRFGDEELKETLESYIEHIKNRNANMNFEKVYADESLGYSQDEKFNIPENFDPCAQQTLINNFAEEQQLDESFDF